LSASLPRFSPGVLFVSLLQFSYLTLSASALFSEVLIARMTSVSTFPRCLQKGPTCPPKTPNLPLSKAFPFFLSHLGTFPGPRPSLSSDVLLPQLLSPGVGDSVVLELLVLSSSPQERCLSNGRVQCFSFGFFFPLFKSPPPPFSFLKPLLRILPPFLPA